jgi:light-regulated signal transduction histidine kinase (bacteriophytochrome)
VAPLRAAAGDATITVGTIVIFRTSRPGSGWKSSCRSPRRWRRSGCSRPASAHEVNTPLTGISSFTQMLLEGSDPEDPRTRLLEKIERQTFRAARIVNGLLTLARPAAVSSGDRTHVDLNVVVRRRGQSARSTSSNCTG